MLCKSTYLKIFKNGWLWANKKPFVKKLYPISKNVFIFTFNYTLNQKNLTKNLLKLEYNIKIDKVGAIE